MNTVFTNTYGIIDYAFCISTSDPNLANCIQHLFNGFSTTHPAPVPFFAQKNPDQSISVSEPNAPCQQFQNIDDFATHFELKMLHRAMANMPFLGLHAGAVSFGNHALIFPGNSGQGKTTLTLGCVLQGAQLLTDEVVLIHPNTLQVAPFYRTINIKKGTLDHVQATLPEFQSLPSQSLCTISGATCLDVSVLSRIPPNETRPIKAIIFPQFHPLAKTTLRPLKRTQALKQLFQHTTNRQKFPNTCLNILGQVVEKAMCYELPMNNLPDALTHLKTELGTPSW